MGSRENNRRESWKHDWEFFQMYCNSLEIIFKFIVEKTETIAGEKFRVMMLLFAAVVFNWF